MVSENCRVDVKGGIEVFMAEVFKAEVFNVEVSKEDIWGQG
jgi:hypothetical protein